jgi:hypothetical protein
MMLLIQLPMQNAGQITNNCWNRIISSCFRRNYCWRRKNFVVKTVLKTYIQNRILTSPPGDAGKKIHTARSVTTKCSLMYICIWRMLSRFKRAGQSLIWLDDNLRENIKMFCCQVIPFTNRDASFCMWFSAMRKPYWRYHHVECSPDGCGPKPIGFRSGLRKFVPDRQNLYHKAGLKPWNTMPLRQMSRGKSEKILAFAMECCRHLGQIFYGCLFVYESEFWFHHYQRI